MMQQRETTAMMQQRETTAMMQQRENNDRERLTKATRGRVVSTSSSFDYERPTCENYFDPAAGFVGKYSRIRAGLDTEYHGVYSRSRQELQDQLLDEAMRGVGGGHVEPWIIFTAGAMGSGKSHTFDWLVEQGIMPLRNVQTIDPDRFKVVFPEWQGYLKRDPLKAGCHTRRESGYMVELAQEAAMRERRHIWVDGSLRDREWYAAEFERIAREHPAYRIAIMHVVARREVVLGRVAARASATGRSVPLGEIDDSLARVPQSVRALGPLADFIAVVDNSDRCPRLVQCCDRESCRDAEDEWEEISRLFALPEECSVTDCEPDSRRWSDAFRFFAGDRQPDRRGGQAELWARYLDI